MVGRAGHGDCSESSATHRRLVAQGGHMDEYQGIHDLSILVVDDHPANTTLLARLLEQGGYNKVHTFTRSAAALESFASIDPDLVLLDWHMPEPNGLTLLREFRKLTAGTYLPILVLTADATTQTQRDALSGGATD